MDSTQCERKQEAVVELQKQGFDAYNDHGIVMFRNAEFKDARKACKSINYKGSFGVKKENIVNE